jgi:hypothetical protein
MTQCLRHLLCGSETVLRILGQHSIQNALISGVDHGQLGHGLLEMHQDGADVRASLVGLPPREHLEEDDPETVDIGPPVHGPVLGLLRTHVERGPQGRSRLGEGRVAAQRLGGEPEIHQHGCPIGAKEDVRRLDIAVDDALFVNKLQGVADLLHDTQGGVSGQAGPYPVLEVPAIDVFHGDVEIGPGLAHIVDSDDVDVVERGDEPPFLEKSLRESRGLPFVR